jgi:hypothetical protein
VSAPAALRAGFAALRRGRLILLLTATAAILGGLVASPLAPSMHDALAGTLAGDHLVRNHPEFAPVDFMDFLREKAPAVAGVRHAMLWAALLGLLLQAFFVGGIVETVGRDPDGGRAAFWSGARLHFAHNVKCLLLFAAAAAILVGGWLAVTGAVGQKIFEDAPPNTAGRSVWTAAAAVVALALFGALKLLATFARSARRASPQIGAIAAFRDGRRRLRGRWLRGLAVLLFWAVLGAAALGSLLLLAWGQATPSPGTVAVNLVLLALILAVRPASLVGAWGSVLALFDGSAPPPVSDWLRTASAWTSAPAPVVAKAGTSEGATGLLAPAPVSAPADPPDVELSPPPAPSSEPPSE